MRKLIPLCLLAILSTPAIAAGNNVIFSCTAQNGTPITITKAGSEYQFSFGKVSFSNPIKTVLSNENSFIATGSGFITSSLEMKNNGTSYTIDFSQPRDNLAKAEAGMLAIGSRENMEIVYCKDNIKHHLDHKMMRKGF